MSLRLHLSIHEEHMTNADSVRSHIQLVRELSNELAAYLYSLPDDVWRDAERYASACDQWKMADVVSHLILEGQANFQSIERSLKGHTSQPMGYHHLEGREKVDRVISVRVAYDEDLFPEFNTSCRRLNSLLASLGPEQYDSPTWHVQSVMPISQLIEHRIVELAVHGWDVRYGLDRSARMSKKAVPFLIGWMERRLRTGFEKSEVTENSVVYRFRLNNPVTKSYDVAISGGDIRLHPSDDADANVTFHCDIDTYILFLMGRLPFARSVRRGRLSFDGDEALASRFIDWFKPL